MVVMLSDRDAHDIHRMLNEWRRNPLALVGGRTSQGRAIDHEEILAPESYVAISPPGGIPALVTLHSPAGSGSGSDSGSGSGVVKYIPGFAVCQIYRILPDPDDTSLKILVEAGFSRVLCNLSPLPVAANTPISTDREKWGVWVIPWPGLNFKVCVTTGSSGSDGSGGSGGGTADCFSGDCGDEGVPASLTATVTEKVGCYTSMPDSFMLDCVSTGPGTHGWETFASIGTICDAVDIHPDVGFDGTRPYIDVPVRTWAEDGWTCSPFSAVFHVNPGGGGGDTCTIVVME